jgi:exodeoxyribonuclease VII large subunit
VNIRVYSWLKFFSPNARVLNMNDSSSNLLAALFAERRVLTVTELTEQVKDTLESEFFALHVQGEVSNYKRHQSGHWYFTLKDSHSQLRAVFYRQWNRLMRFEPENGLEVRLRGRLSVYEPRGEYQLIVEIMEPLGVGAATRVRATGQKARRRGAVR